MQTQFMSVSQEQLREIHRQLKDFFLSHPAISIKPTKGDPPEQYEITYKIKGFSKPDKSEASLTTNHRIELTIPFGFPHFPPSCKPKSDIFHPDFDPAAICLGDFWQQHSKISDLIVFIGKLINGESYSTNNAFNEDAAIWYQDHSDAFPITEVKWSDRVSESTEYLEDWNPQIDTIDDADLSPDFDFPSTTDSLPDQEELTLNTSFPVINEPSGTDISAFQLLQNQKKFFKLRQTLDKSTILSDQIQKISAYTQEEIKKAEELYQSAKKVESSGNLKNAARLYEQVVAITTDFPNIEADQRRVMQSLALLGKAKHDPMPDFTDFDYSDKPKIKDLPVPEKSQSPKSSGKRKPPPPPPPTKKSDSFLTKKRLSGKIAFFFVIGIFLVILSAGWFYHFSAQGKIDASSAALSKCKSLIDNEQFDFGKLSCDNALESLSNIQFIQQSRVKELRNSINEILVSEKLSQGLAGKILVEGKYLPKKDAAALISYNQLQKEGEELFDQENWTQAEERFIKFLTITSKSTLVSPSVIEDIKSKLNFTRFSMVFSSASTLLASNKWQEAASEIKKARSLLESLPEKDRQRYAVELSSALAKCNFEDFRKQGDDFFSKADWQNAISSYKSVLPTVEEGKIAPQETIDALRENISRAELYATIDMGNKAFISGAWNEAIQEYNKAVSIRSANQGTIKLTDSQVTRKKIDRIILQTTIIRDRQAAKILQDDKKDLTAARNAFRQIVATINNSGFAAEDEFLETKKACIATIQVLDERIYQADKEQYLKDNFRSLFAANYTSAIPENLNTPVITYVKEANGRMIFKMQCTETGRGRPMTLIMFYSYDKVSNHWDFFSEQQ
ncbi:MAG: ubiquitin-conjugating enzyme E2 [Proteobacteria bacterium]|nr:ubiquitin-conjugating enzyme E2 [Pseudomonadota bacterium]